jgi:hypothetical protein
MSDMPQKTTREVLCFLEDEDVVDNNERITGVVDVPHVTAQECQAVRVSPHPVVGKFLRSVVGVTFDKGQHLLTERLALNVNVFGVPEILNDPSLTGKDAKALGFVFALPVMRCLYNCRMILGAPRNDAAHEYRWTI